jgi:hypothetical protein
LGDDTGGGRGKSSKMSPDVADDDVALGVAIDSPKDDRRRRIDKGLCGIGCGGWWGLLGGGLLAATGDVAAATAWGSWNWITLPLRDGTWLARRPLLTPSALGMFSEGGSGGDDAASGAAWARAWAKLADGRRVNGEGRGGDAAARAAVRPDDVDDGRAGARAAPDAVEGPGRRLARIDADNVADGAVSLALACGCCVKLPRRMGLSCIRAPLLDPDDDDAAVAAAAAVGAAAAAAALFGGNDSCCSLSDVLVVPKKLWRRFGEVPWLPALARPAGFVSVTRDVAAVGVRSPVSSMPNHERNDDIDGSGLVASERDGGCPVDPRDGGGGGVRLPLPPLPRWSSWPAEARPDSEPR